MAALALVVFMSMAQAGRVISDAEGFGGWNLDNVVGKSILATWMSQNLSRGSGTLAGPDVDALSGVAKACSCHGPLRPGAY
jgi:hypothetical protein